MKWRIVGIASAVALCSAVALPSTALADPVVVQAGAFTVEEDGGTGFQLSGDGLSADGSGNLGSVFSGIYWPAQFHGASLPAGASITFNTSVGGALGWSHSDSTTANGVTYTSTVYYSGTFGFVTPKVTIPDTQGTTVFNEPFAFTGQLVGFDNPALSGAALFSIPLAGTGTFTGFVAGTPRSGYEPLIDFTYVFTSSTSPTPEPASLILFGVGVVGVIARRFTTAA